jgi:hypothetical protein
MGPGVTPEDLERLQSLRDRLQEMVNDEFNVVASDLAQLRRLLSDAAEKLSGTFQVVTASSSDLRTTIACMPSSSDSASLARIRDLAAEIASTTGTTIQSLQFEDMATQLLQHVDRKLAILARLSRDMAVLNPTAAGVSPLVPADQLDVLFRKFESYRTELAAASRKVVQQESLESGDIELF